MVGPVLLKQSHEEAKLSVESRLGYIEGEIKRVEGLIEEVQGKMEEKRREIVEAQVKAQQAGGVGGE
jgi:prefoldin beta subunit